MPRYSAASCTESNLLKVFFIPSSSITRLKKRLIFFTINKLQLFHLTVNAYSAIFCDVTVTYGNFNYRGVDMSSKKQLENLNKILELIQVDVEELTAKERISFLIRANVLGTNYEAISPLFENIVSHNSPKLNSQFLASVSKEFWNHVVSRLRSIRNFLDWLSNHLHKCCRIEYKVNQLLTWNKEGGFSNREFDYPELSFSVKAYELGKTLLPDGESTPGKLLKEFTLGGEFYALAKALNGVLVSDIKRCENKKCKKIFVQVTKREKRFCSTRCQNTMAVRRLRSRKITK